MKRTYFDDEDFMDKTIEVEENADLVLNNMSLLKKIKMDYYLKRLIAQDTDLLEAIGANIFKKEIDNYFSDKVALVLKKLKKDMNPKRFSFGESIIFVCDFIMPIAYGNTVLEDNSFKYRQILIEAKFFWQSISEIEKKELYSLSYQEEYKEPKFNSEEIFINEIKKYPDLRRILAPCIDITWNYNELLSYRHKLPQNIYAYCVKYLYTIQTKDVSTELLRKIFEGLSKEDFMGEEDFLMYNSLPEEIRIFRGTDFDEKIPRPSWTLNYEVAKKFSRGQQIMMATIPKERIIAYRNTVEEEVLVWVDENEVKNGKK